jgi:hypothetical protein
MSIDWNEDYRDEECKGGLGHSWFSIYYQARGGEGSSWFEVELTSDYVSADNTGIILDTTAPEHPTFIVNNGGASTDQQVVTAHLAHCDFPVRRGYQIKIWGNVDASYDPNIKATEAESQWVAFSPTRMVKLSQYNGDKNLHAKIRDDVWNETAALNVVVTLTGQPEPPPVTEPTITIGDAPSFTSMPILGQDFEQKWAAEVDSRLPIINLLKVAGSVALVKSVTVTASAQVSASRLVEFRANGTRLPASRWNRIIEEDEELLLSL